MKKKKAMPAPKLTEPEPCVVCGAMHQLHMGTWIITAKGDLLCANDRCWRIAVEREKNGEETKSEMDPGAT
tara:strand:- start:113 stop:325 length:213 start_codon:yes stop_codon:yes gene_type:complete